ncbi:cilia- and flagella-associated protein 206 [Lampetra fluviatilis]
MFPEQFINSHLKSFIFIFKKSGSPPHWRLRGSRAPKGPMVWRRGVARGLPWRRVSEACAKEKPESRSGELNRPAVKEQNNNDDDDDETQTLQKTTTDHSHAARMSRAQAEGVIKNIIREIGQASAARGCLASETLVAFMVKAVVLDPRNGFNVDRTLTKEDVQKLIKLCEDRLLDNSRPSLETIKMQVYFDMNYTTRAEFLEEHRRVLETRLAPIQREITDSRARSREELEALYRKVVSYVLLSSGLGSPTHIAVVREATAALQSVFPQTDLGTFLAMTKKEKEQQLTELSLITTGIRLFNKKCGKGGEGIDDLPAILNEAIPAATKHLDAELGSTRQLAHRYTAILEQCSDPADQLVRAGIFPDTLRELLFNCRQHECFLKILLGDMITSAGEVESLQSQLASHMDALQGIIQAKQAVPTTQVYPHFMAVARVWCSFQDQMVLLSVLSNVMTNLTPFLEPHGRLCPETLLVPLVGSIAEKSDAQRLQEAAGDQVNPADFKSQEWLFPKTTRNLDRLPIQYRGFCAYTLAARDTLLLPGNTNIGVLRHREKLYTFSSKQAACAFASNPDHFVGMVAEAARRSAELIQLLELHQQFAVITPYSRTREQGGPAETPITKCDSGTQTDTHILESSIVRSYEWNEWELRRKAIKLANLRRKATHSAQTDLSHLRRDGATQVYLPREVGTQTKREGTTNVPRPSVYLAGLRGGPAGQPTRAVQVDLTRYPEQP